MKMTLKDTTLMESQQKTLKNGWRKLEMRGEFIINLSVQLSILLFSSSLYKFPQTALQAHFFRKSPFGDL